LLVQTQSDPRPEVLNPFSNGKHLAEQLYPFHSVSGIRAKTEYGRRVVQDNLAVPQAIVSDLEGQTVHVEAVETEAVWAYRWRWQPLVTFQAYAAYTPRLDEENARLLRSRQRPTRILRYLPPEAIDGRNGLFDQPRTTLVEVCQYRVVMRLDGWESAAPGPSRCGPALPGPK